MFLFVLFVFFFSVVTECMEIYGTEIMHMTLRNLRNDCVYVIFKGKVI